MVSYSRAGSSLFEARMRLLFVEMALGESLAHEFVRLLLALARRLGVDLLTAWREITPAVGEIALGRDPVVVERPVVVLE